MHPTDSNEPDHTLVSRDPDVLGGTPVFPRTRVPVAILFQYVVDNESLEQFLDDFPSVSRQQVIDLLKHAASLVPNEAAA